MRTARLLPVSPSMHCTRGYLPLVQGGGVPASGPRGGYLPLVWGGCLLWGVPASGPWGGTPASDPGGCLPQGVYLPLVLGGGFGLWSGGGRGRVCIPACSGEDPPASVDRMTDTREKHNLHKLRLRVATSLRHYAKVLSVSWQNI